MTANGDIVVRPRALRRYAVAVVAAGVAACGALGVAGAAQAADAASSSSGTATRAQQWYLNQFGMTTVWQTSRGNGVTVAIVGSGVDVGQSDISGASLPQVDFSTGNPKPAQGDVSASNDGTTAAILIAGSGTDKSGIEGLAPKAKILPLRYYADEKDTATPAYAAVAIRYAADHGARVILMPSPAPYNAASLTDAVGYALSKGAIVITSASNNGRTSNQMTAPCTIRGAVCVSGTTQDGTVWKDSSTGSSVTLGAPAENLPVWAQDKYGIHSSTHYSAALVAGEAALVLGAHPTWTAGQLISVMIDTATGGNAAHTRVNDKVGYGVMNPAGAVAAPQPASTGNPLAPASASSPSAASPTKAPSVAASASAGAHSGTGTGHGDGKGTSSGSSSGGSSVPWLLIGIGAAAVVLGGLLVVVLLRQRSGGGRNYLSDPAYQAGQYYSDSGAYNPDAGWPQAGPQPQYQPQYQPQSQYPVDNFARPEPEQQFEAQPQFPQTQPQPPFPQPQPEQQPQPPQPQSGYTDIPASWLQAPAPEQEGQQGAEPADDSQQGAAQRPDQEG